MQEPRRGKLGCCRPNEELMYRIITNNYGMPIRLYQKILLVMRLTTVILIASLMQVSAAGFAQRVTLDHKNTTLQQIFKEISRQTGYSLFYDGRILPKNHKVDISVKDASVEEAMTTAIKGLPLRFEINEKGVLIKKKEEATFLENVIARFQTIDVRGRVVDTLGRPIQGASILLIETNKRTVSDHDGSFRLKDCPATGKLLITNIGFESVTISYKEANLSIIMNNSTSSLDEVHIIAYGTTSQRLTTGNIGRINSTAIQSQPISNPLLALSGRLAGVLVQQNSGVPGAGVTIRIQGVNSIGKGREPFFVVDGSPYIPQVLPTLTEIQGASGDDYIGKNQGGGNPFSFLNPSDIESIEVLKDADATAIYGSRAANGAILITTKKGKPGKTKIDFMLQNGIGRVANRMELLNTQQYLEMRKEAYKNGNLPVPNRSSSKTSTNYDLTVWDQNKYTNWQEELIGGRAMYSDLQAGISGGTAMTTFRLNAGYHRETTVYPGKFSDVKASLGLNLNHSSTNQKFKFALSGNYLVDNNKLPSADLTSLALTTAPNAPSLYRADGTLNWERIPSGTDSLSTWTNPLSNLISRYHINTNTLVSNLNLSYQLLSGLTLTTNLGYTNLQTNEVSMRPLLVVKPEQRPNQQRLASYGNGSISSWIIEPQLNYNSTLLNGRLEILLGGTFQENKNNLQQLAGRGFSSDEVLGDFKAASFVAAERSIQSLYKYNAVFARLNYNYLDRYIVNFTARRDGSSRFGSENKFHNFGAVGISWIFSNEEFLEENSFLSYGKFRGSYGTTGNDQIGDYTYLNQYETIYAANPYQNIVGLQTVEHPNPYLQWELTKKLQGGIDLGFFKDRVLINAGYYNNRSSNQLIGYALPGTTGFGSVFKNFPATIQNSGWEFTLSTINLKNKSVSWSTNVNFTLGKNKLISFPNLSTSTYASSLIIGEPINVERHYRFAQVNPQTGIYEYYSADGKIVPDPDFDFDRTELYRPLQNVFGGLQNTVGFRGFQLDVFVQFVKQYAKNFDLGLGNRTGFFNLNQPVSVLNRWQNPGDITNIQKYSTTLLTINYAQGSTASFSDASYLRVKNISLAWTIPPSWTKSVLLESCRLFARGQNLLTFTKYNGLDPENLNNSSLPPLRVWTFGVQVTL